MKSLVISIQFRCLSTYSILPIMFLFSRHPYLQPDCRDVPTPVAYSKDACAPALGVTSFFAASTSLPISRFSHLFYYRAHAAHDHFS